MSINNYLDTVNLQHTKPCWQNFVEESVVFTFFFCETNGNHATEPSTVGHLISERHWKSNFDFTEIINNYSLRQETLCKIVKFVSQFSLKLYIQF